MYFLYALLGSPTGLPPSPRGATSTPEPQGGGVSRCEVAAVCVVPHERGGGGGAWREAAARPRVFVSRPAARPPRLPPPPVKALTHGRERGTFLTWRRGEEEK